MGQVPTLTRGQVPARPRVSSLTLEEFLLIYPRIAGADGDGDGGDGGDGGGDGGAGGTGGDGAGAAGGSGSGGSGDSGAGGTGGDGDEKFDKAYVTKLRSEAAANRKRATEAEARLQKIADKDKSELERAQEAATTHETRATAAEAKVARFEAAAAAGLELKHAGRIQGSTPEEMLEDAKALAKEFGGARRTGFDGGARGGQEPGTSINDLIRQAAGRR